MSVLQRVAQDWRIRGRAVVRGRLRPPADKSLLHRSLLLAALADGVSSLRGVAGDDVRRTAAALQQLGIRVSTRADGLCVEGRGLYGLHASRTPIDCGNSGTTMRLLGGLLAAQPFRTVLQGDASLQARPMSRLVEPLRAMGAHVDTLGADGRPPLRVGRDPETALQGRQHRLEVDSAQVRSALLLAGLYALGPTRIGPASAARDHTERMLGALGVNVRRDDDGTILHPRTTGRSWSAFDFALPGDLSSAAFFVCLAAAQPGARLQVTDCGLNPGRRRVVDVLQRSGARVSTHVVSTQLGEAVGRLAVHGGTLRSLQLVGDDVVACIDEIPALLAAAAVSGCAATVRDAAELRVKESDRIEAMAQVLSHFGAQVRTRRDGLVLAAGTALRACRVASHGDHRIAMAAAMLASRCPGVSVVEDVACVGTSYPGFDADFNRLLRRVEA
jgi:3-phosphoshikimate 1-carboxyvinyltransferase